MCTRRKFIKTGLAGTGALLVTGARSIDMPVTPGKGPIILSTWSHGMPANKRAWEVLQGGGSVLDAVEQGVAVVESDFSNRSVGLGGLPDRDGKVTLDACIQDGDGRAGAVAFMQRFENPIKIARAVMERTPHVMLVGDGAERWALENGFKRKDVEIPEVRQRWQEWLKKSEYKPEMNIEEKLQRKVQRGTIDDHDTIMIPRVTLEYHDRPRHPSGDQTSRSRSGAQGSGAAVRLLRARRAGAGVGYRSADLAPRR